MGVGPSAGAWAQVTHLSHILRDSDSLLSTSGCVDTVVVVCLLSPVPWCTSVIRKQGRTGS